MRVNEHPQHRHNRYDLLGINRVFRGPYLRPGVTCPEGHSACQFPYSAVCIHQDTSYYYFNRNTDYSTISSVHDFEHTHDYRAYYVTITWVDFFRSPLQACPKAHSECQQDDTQNMPGNLSSSSYYDKTTGREQNAKVNSKGHSHSCVYYLVSNVNDARLLSSGATECPEGHSYCVPVDIDYVPVVVNVTNTETASNTSVVVG